MRTQEGQREFTNLPDPRGILSVESVTVPLSYTDELYSLRYAAPGATAGLLQLNVRIPPDAPRGCRALEHGGRASSNKGR